MRGVPPPLSCRSTFRQRKYFDKNYSYITILEKKHTAVRNSELSIEKVG